MIYLIQEGQQTYLRSIDCNKTSHRRNGALALEESGFGIEMQRFRTEKTVTGGTELSCCAGGRRGYG